MKFISDFKYTENEAAINLMLRDLFNERYETAKNKSFIKSYTNESMVFDGFYPCYTQQKVKILFIGRESLNLTGENYIDIILDGYKNNELDDKEINQYRTHRLLLKICHGLNNNLCNFNAIPQATEIAKTFGTESGISCAFMNLSKFSNDTSSKNANWPLINSFIDAFKEHDFSSREIEILNPDLIISMNLEGLLDSFGETKIIELTDDIAYRKLTISGKSYNVLDTYHFSATKKEEQCYYKPIVDMCLKHNLINDN